MYFNNIKFIPTLDYSETKLLIYYALTYIGEKIILTSNNIE